MSNARHNPNSDTSKSAVRADGDTEADAQNRSLPFSERYRQRRASGVMSLNLTPMIDVVFLLLFFFLTVSRFRGNEGMLAAELASPSAETAVEIPRVPLRIRLKTSAADPAQCVVTIDDFHETTPLLIGQLSQVLNHIRNGQPGFDSDTPVQLYADEGVVWDHMTNAYNAAIAARFEKVFFD